MNFSADILKDSKGNVYGLNYTPRHDGIVGAGLQLFLIPVLPGRDVYSFHAPPIILGGGGGMPMVPIG